MKIVIDAFGGDNAPLEIVKGAILGLQENKNVKIVLTGNKQIIEDILKEQNFSSDRLEIIDAKDVITNDDVPTLAIRNKKDSSLVVAFDNLKQDEEVLGLISAGSTGALLTGGILKIGRLKGVSRPAMCPILPTLKENPVCICDCGANADSKPINLCHFALMATEYYKAMFGVNNPRVALLNIGTEEHKGNELVKETYQMLKQLPINFVGNMEARELLSGDYDIVVCDGFAGNVLLKSTEGAVLNVMNMLKKSIKSSKKSMFGALFMRKSFKNLKSKLDYSKYGGSPFLGCKKTIIKAHGTSKAENIKVCINQVIQLSKNDYNKNIEESLQSLQIKED